MDLGGGGRGRTHPKVARVDAGMDDSDGRHGSAVLDQQGVWFVRRGRGTSTLLTRCVELAIGWIEVDKKFACSR